MSDPADSDLNIAQTLVVIVGVGPIGLSISAGLKQAGVDHLDLTRGRSGIGASPELASGSGIQQGATLSGCKKWDLGSFQRAPVAITGHGE